MVENLSKKLLVQESEDSMRSQKNYPNWEEKLVHAAFAIATTGEITAISRKIEFELEVPSEGFKYIEHKYNSSFQTCIIGFAHFVEEAFRYAHEMMGFASVTISTIPDRIQFGNNELLANIKETTRECKWKTEAVAETFAKVLSMIQMLIQSCVHRQSKFKKKKTEGEVIEVLGLVIDLLVKLQKQCCDIQRFFRHLYLMIESTIAQYDQFKDLMRFFQENKRRQEGFQIDESTKDCLMKMASHVVNNGLIFKQIATKYYDISNNYLMPSVSSIGELLSISNEDMEKKQLELLNRCEDTSNVIKEMVEKSKKEVKNKINNYIKELETFFEMDNL